MMATKWEMSPISLKMFIAVGVLASPVPSDSSLDKKLCPLQKPNGSCTRGGVLKGLKTS